MALEGSIKDFGLVDILQLIYYQRKSGVLTVDGKTERVKIGFLEGNIVTFDTKILKETKNGMEMERIGRILLKKGLLNEKQLNDALLEHEKSKEKLATVLVKKGYIDVALMKEILQNKIVEIMVKVFSWRAGYYSFVPQNVSIDKEIPISVNTQHMLMEGLRIQDEWALIEGKITLDTIFKKTDSEDAELTGSDREILDHIDGENEVRTIIELCDLDDFEAFRSLLSLLERGIIVQVREKTPFIDRISPINKVSHFIGLLWPAILLAAFVIGLIPLINRGDSSLKFIRAAKDLELFNFYIEKYSIENKRYPEDLSPVGDTIDPWGNQYRYRITEKGFLVFSIGEDGREGTEDDIF